MIGVQDQADIKISGSFRIRNFPFEEIEEIGGVRQRGLRLDGSETLTDPIPRRDDRGEFGNESLGLGHIDFLPFHSGLGVVICQHGNRGLENVHGMGRSRSSL